MNGRPARRLDHEAGSDAEERRVILRSDAEEKRVMLRGDAEERREMLRSDAEERTLTSNNVGAALTNYSNSFVLLKYLLIFWLHVILKY